MMFDLSGMGKSAQLCRESPWREKLKVAEMFLICQDSSVLKSPSACIPGPTHSCDPFPAQTVHNAAFRMPD